MRVFKFVRRARALVTILIVFFSLVLFRPAYSASPSLVVSTDRQLYNVGDTATFTGSVNNGSDVSDALVLFEVDTPENNPWIIRTLTTGQTPAGPWLVELVNVTPTDEFGNPVYAFQAGSNAGFEVTITNNALTSYPVVVVINLFFSNGLPFVLQPIFNGTLAAGQTVTASTWPIVIPASSVVGQAMVYASVFNNYPKNDGYAYSPEQSAAFNITSGIPAQAPPSNATGEFNLTVPLTSSASMPINLGNYSVYATTRYPYSSPFFSGLPASSQTMFTLRLVADVSGPNGVPDGIVNVWDILFVARAYLSTPGSPNWNPAADVCGPTNYMSPYPTPDGVVNIWDLLFVARYYLTVANLPP